MASETSVVVTLAKGKQNVSACIFDVETSCACALEPRIYNDCGNWSGPSIGLDPGYPDFDEFRMIELYTRREEIIKLLVIPESNLRLIISTTAFGMGIDCPDISRIIHWDFQAALKSMPKKRGGQEVMAWRRRLFYLVERLDDMLHPQ